VERLTVQTESGELTLEPLNASEAWFYLASPTDDRYYPASHLSEEDRGKIENIRCQVVGLFEKAAGIVRAAPTHEEELPGAYTLPLPDGPTLPTH